MPEPRDSRLRDGRFSSRPDAEPGRADAAPEPPEAGAAPQTSEAPAPGPATTMLRGPHMPADRGLSSLGLLMQLAGTLGMVGSSLLALTGAFGQHRLAGLLFVGGVFCGIRSAYHRAAGNALLYGTGSAPLRGVRQYIWVSAGQTAFCLFLLKDIIDTAALIQVAAVLLIWPLTLQVYFASPKPRALATFGIPDGEDHGFEGTAVLMTVFGWMGLLGALFALFLTVDALLDAWLTSIIPILVMLGSALLLIRSFRHVRAGLRGISGDATYEEYSAVASHYYNFGIASAACVGTAVFVITLVSSRVSPLGVALMLGAPVGLALYAWPSLLRRFYLERRFSVYLAGDGAPVFQRAPDNGLTALGWLLVAVSVVGLALSVGAALGSMHWHWVWRGAPSWWWLAGTSCLSLWAGIELVRMSERHKIAAVVYGGVGILAACALWPQIDDLHIWIERMFVMDDAPSGLVRTALLHFHVALALASLVLATRTAAPSAVARIRAIERADIDQELVKP